VLHCRELFAALDRCEEMLGRSRYLLGGSITEADVRLFMTLIRFDEVYVSNKAVIMVLLSSGTSLPRSQVSLASGA
jgi:glutathione S-transferase